MNGPTGERKRERNTKERSERGKARKETGRVLIGMKAEELKKRREERGKGRKSEAERGEKAKTATGKVLREGAVGRARARVTEWGEGSGEW